MTVEFIDSNEHRYRNNFESLSHFRVLLGNRMELEGVSQTYARRYYVATNHIVSWRIVDE